MFRNLTKPRKDGCYVQFERVIKTDDLAQPGDTLFKDPANLAADKKRLEAYNNGRWHYLIVSARANILFVENGIGTLAFVESSGTPQVPSVSRELASIYANERAKLERMLASINCMTEESNGTDQLCA